MIVLITGGASGLGEAITRKLANDANNVVYFTYNTSKLNAEKIKSDFPNTVAIRCNFKNRLDIDRLNKKIPEITPAILINNAYSGTFLKKHFHKTPVDDFSTDFEQNVLPVILITQQAIKYFREKGGGQIVTVLTAALFNTPPIGSVVYLTTKAYLYQLSKAWAAENARYNIKVNTVSPSFMLTNLTKDVDERVVMQIKENTPQKKLLTTVEVAEAVANLIHSPDTPNGADIMIDTETITLT